MQPVTHLIESIVFFEINILGVSTPLIVLWLIFAGLFFTLYFRLINLRGMSHSIRLLLGSRSGGSRKEGELSHFQALSTALSGTVGIGNIGGMAIVISLGGPGAVFWLIIAGFLGMATKFVECIAGVKYRTVHPDGTVSGGPMHYLKEGLAAKGMRRLGKGLGYFYAIAMVIGCLGIGNMFQSNQAYEQFVFATGADQSFFMDKGWLFGILMATMVGFVIIGGLRSIARVTSRLVPLMAVLYLALALAVIVFNSDKLPAAISSIFNQAFTAPAVGGGILGSMILGFRRAVFSNEAGIGSAAIAHSTVQTDEPATEGYVGLLEPFIDTVVICTITSLVILTTIYVPSEVIEMQGIDYTSKAFASTLSWSVTPLAFIAILFAFSTMISWSYYGLKGWTFLVGKSKRKELQFQFVFCLFVALGCTIQLDSVLDFSDALVFVVSIPNIIGLYILAPEIKREVVQYRQRRQAK